MEGERPHSQHRPKVNIVFLLMEWTADSRGDAGANVSRDPTSDSSVPQT